MSRPEIWILKSEKQRLTSLAEAALNTSPDVADELLTELERAKPVEAFRAPKDLVVMNSQVLFETEGKRLGVTLVFPGDADILAGRVSILTPVGAALIGLSVGQTMKWRSLDGRVHRLRVLEVTQPNDP
jgi:regulator of nucleoside diphosphate kinase